MADIKTKRGSVDDASRALVRLRTSVEKVIGAIQYFADNYVRLYGQAATEDEKAVIAANSSILFKFVNSDPRETLTIIHDIVDALRQCDEGNRLCLENWQKLIEETARVDIHRNTETAYEILKEYIDLLVKEKDDVQQELVSLREQVNEQERVLLANDEKSRLAIRELEDQLANTNELSDPQKKVIECKAANAALSSELDLAMIKINELKKSNSELKSETSKLDQNSRKYKNLYDKCSEASQALREQVETLTQAESKAEKDLSELSEKYDKSEKDRLAAGIKLDEKILEFEKLLRERDATIKQKDIDMKKIANETIENVAGECAEQVRKARAKAGKIQALLQSSEEKNARLAKENRELTERVENYNTNETGYGVQIAELQDEANELAAQLRASENTIRQMETSKLLQKQI